MPILDRKRLGTLSIVWHCNEIAFDIARRKRFRYTLASLPFLEKWFLKNKPAYTPAQLISANVG